MKARNPPPDYVRSVTLGPIDRQRDAFNRFIDALRGRAAQSSDRRWSFAYHHKLSQFGSLSDFERKFADERGPGPARAEGGRPGH
ncbi:hypothetical protein C0214_02215 [Methylobacterium sp. DM1]|nr:hypothetical protein C0214_02215 [Methylobacterium sp. DM1]